MSRLQAQEAQVERLEQRLASITDAIDREEEMLQARRDVVGETASQALLAGDQSRQAEEQAVGRLLGQTVFRLEGIGFEPGTATLTTESRTLLDQLADRLRAEDAGYFLEVRPAGTDGEGGAGALWQAQAEAVRHYLHDDRGLPLHALSTLTGGGDSPAAKASDPALGGGQTATLVVEPPPGHSLAVVVVRPFPRL